MPIKKGKGKGILMLIYFSHDFFQFSTSKKQDCHMITLCISHYPNYFQSAIMKPVMLQANDFQFLETYDQRNVANDHCFKIQSILLHHFVSYQKGNKREDGDAFLGQKSPSSNRQPYQKICKTGLPQIHFCPNMLLFFKKLLPLKSSNKH